MGDVVEGFIRLENVRVIGFVITAGNEDNYRQFVLGRSWAVTWMP